MSADNEKTIMIVVGRTNEESNYKDLTFRIVRSNPARVSRPFVLKGEHQSINGNPYLVYGPTVKKYLGLEDKGSDWSNGLRIIVSTMSSGNIDDWS